MAFEVLNSVLWAKPAYMRSIYAGDVLRKENPLPPGITPSQKDASVLENLAKAKGSLYSLRKVCRGSDIYLGASAIPNVVKISELTLFPNRITGKKEDPRNLNSLKRLIQGRPYAIIKNPYSNLFYLIKNDYKDGKNADELMIYEKRSKSFIPLNQKMLNDLNIPEQAAIALFNRDKNVAVAYDSPLYHEKQTQGQCGIHAANAFLGGRYVSPNALSAFNKEFFSIQLGIQDPNSELLNATQGNDPGPLAAFIRQLALDKKAPKRFKNIVGETTGKMDAKKLDIIKLFEANYDRCIIGNSRHFVAFRKENNQWHCIDSLTRKVRKKTPSQLMKRSKRAFQLIHEGPHLF